MKCPIIKSTGKEYAWLTQDLKKIISKKDAIALYNLFVFKGKNIFYNKEVGKKYPVLNKYLEESEIGISTLMLNVALREIGKIED